MIKLNYTFKTDLFLKPKSRKDHNSELHQDDIDFLYQNIKDILLSCLEYDIADQNSLIIKKSNYLDEKNVSIIIYPKTSTKYYFSANLKLRKLNDKISPFSLYIMTDPYNITLFKGMNTSIASSLFKGTKIQLDNNFGVKRYDCSFYTGAAGSYLIKTDISIGLKKNRATIKLDIKNNKGISFDNISKLQIESIIYYLVFIEKVINKKAEFLSGYPVIFENSFIARLPRTSEELDEQIKYFLSISIDDIKNSLTLIDMLAHGD